MKKQNFVTMLRYFAKKSAYIAFLCRANFFAVRLAWFRTLAFSNSKLTFLGLHDVVA